MKRDCVISKIRKLPEDYLQEVDDFIENLLIHKRMLLETDSKENVLLFDVIGSCNGPEDLAERHNKYIYGQE